MNGEPSESPADQSADPPQATEPPVQSKVASPVQSPAEPIGCPPPAQRSIEPAHDPRHELLQLAAALTRTRSHRLLIEYLRLRRAAG